LGGIKIAPGNSRRDIIRKLQELEEQKDNGYITLDEYDTLRIRYERKLGNREAVSQLQERKGFKPSNITDKKAKRQELYDDFVDKYAKRANDNAEKRGNSSVSSGSKRMLILLFVLLAFGIGIVAGVSILQSNMPDVGSNLTVTDSAFTANSTIGVQNNTTQNATANITPSKKSTYKQSTSKSNSSSKYSSSRNSSGSSYSNDGSSSGSSSAKKRQASSSYGSESS